MPVTITHTEVGRAIIIDRKVATMEKEGQGTRGSIALGILLDKDGKPDVWCLFWEWGGDWMGFGDAERNDPEALQGWEPDAVREAVSNIGGSYGEDCADDMQWFSQWADDAEATIGANEPD